MSTIETELLRCPDCQGDISRALKCTQCGRQFTYELGIYDLLPERLGPAKKNEDRVFAAGSDELRKTQSRPWRRIIGRHEVLRFDDEILGMLPKGRFLELGGETCFASAIYKSEFSECMVYASDVSPNALRHVAIPAAGLFPERPDFFVALDAENIPFRENTFDSILAMTMMHHLPDPAKMLREVHRVLRCGGRFVGVDGSVPGHFRWLFAATASARASKYGIQEGLLSYRRWVSIVRESGIPLESLHVYTSPKYQYSALHLLAGELVSRLPVSVARWLFPVGIMIVYDKQ